jgi:hypothetical protein
MKILLRYLLALALIASGTPHVQAQEKSANAPQLAIRRLPEASNARFQVQLRNPTDHDLMLDIGTVLGSVQVPRRIQLFLTGKDGRTLQVEPLRGNAGIIGGRVDPMLLPLPAGASYSFPVDLKNYFAPEAHIWQLMLPSGHYKLKAEYESEARPDYTCYGVASWKGMIESPTVEFTLLPPTRRSNKER